MKPRPLFYRQSSLAPPSAAPVSRERYMLKVYNKWKFIHVYEGVGVGGYSQKGEDSLQQTQFDLPH